MGRVSRDSDLPDSDFGDLSKELSVVTEIPEHELPSAPAGVKTVLVVDDEPEIRLMIERLLKGKGYRVVSTDNGRAALAMLKDHAPDLIILDAMLPEVHGFEIARRIKHSERYGHVPIIMVSAVYRGWRYAEDLKQNFGVDAFIEKPFRIADVVAKVEECLANRSVPPAAEPNENDGLSREAERLLAEGVAAYQAGRIDGPVSHHLRLRLEIAVEAEQRVIDEVSVRAADLRRRPDRIEDLQIRMHDDLERRLRGRRRSQRECGCGREEMAKLHGFL